MENLTPMRGSLSVAVPFIGGLRVGEPMTASVGDQVTPGYSVEVGPGEKLGHGLYMTDRGPVAVLSGNLVSNSGVISVDSSAPPINTPKMGDVIIGEVNRLNEKTAELRVLHIETNEGGHRAVPALKLFADVFVSEIVDRFIPSAGDTMRKRDIVRAKIINVEPMLKATTKGDSELGVLYAACPPCGEDLLPSETTPDFNVECPRCDYRGFRALSNGFGHGFEIPSGSDIQKLNRPGERWSSEAESMLGHDGARPYLSPVADHRRGWSHEIPESAKRSPSSRGRGGGRPQREMHPAKCTLCGTQTKVPFKPTPGKPLRCRDCMDRVESGKASKDDLAKEREVMKKARGKAQKEFGVKLFVGGVSYDATEDELREAFSVHGKLNDVHMAMDKETKKPRGFAFITFKDKNEAKAAIKSMNKSEFKGRRISVEESSSGGRGHSKRRRRK
jgi:CxxC-x17-CxxC domain-containing protein